MLLVIAGNQVVTQLWWDKYRGNYELYVSMSVKDEIGAGDAEAANARIQAIVGIPFVSYTEDVGNVVKALLSNQAVLAKATEDALQSWLRQMGLTTY